MKKDEIKNVKPLLQQHIVSGSANPNFLKVAVDELLTYRTPKKIVDYIEAEKMKSIIGNPPFDVSGHYR
jgi:hypothetical protein